MTHGIQIKTVIMVLGAQMEIVRKRLAMTLGVVSLEVRSKVLQTWMRLFRS
jgi:hypothetical protein